MTKDHDLYSEKMISIPAPRFVIFYNGEKKRPEQEVLRLSDAYFIREEHPALELEAVMLNINAGNNPELLKACKSLGEYAEYVAKVRRYAKDMALAEAVERAITECIQEGILADFLERNRAEVKKVSLYEYDAEKHMQQVREDGIEEGKHIFLKETVMKMVKKDMNAEEIADMLGLDIETIREVMEK